MQWTWPVEVAWHHQPWCDGHPRASCLWIVKESFRPDLALMLCCRGIPNDCKQYSAPLTLLHFTKYFTWIRAFCHIFSTSDVIVKLWWFLVPDHFSSVKGAPLVVLQHTTTRIKSVFSWLPFWNGTLRFTANHNVLRKPAGQVGGDFCLRGFTRLHDWHGRQSSAMLGIM